MKRFPCEDETPLWVKDFSLQTYQQVDMVLLNEIFNRSNFAFGLWL